MKKKPKKMTRELKYIGIEKLERLAGIISNVLKNFSKFENPGKRKRGRPKTYSDEFILLLFLLQITLRLSFRGLRHYAKFLFKGQKIPEILNLHYRFRRIDEKSLQEAHRKVLEILGTEGEIFEVIAVDGTGFGYDAWERVKWKRGKEMRMVKSHVKPEIIVGKRESGEDIILDMKIGPAYSDERVLLKKLLREREWRSKFIMADALYGMDVEILRGFYKRAEKVVVPVRDTIHTRVKHPLRVQAKRDYEENRDRYGERSIVERAIGKIKNVYGSCIPTNSEEKARKIVWLMVILYNWALLVALGSSLVIFIFLGSRYSFCIMVNF